MNGQPQDEFALYFCSPSGLSAQFIHGHRIQLNCTRDLRSADQVDHKASNDPGFFKLRQPAMNDWSEGEKGKRY